MNQHKIDARGLSCPLPVVMASKAIKEGYEWIEVTVSEEVAKENLVRLAKSSGMKFSHRDEGGAIIIVLSKG